MTFSRILLWLGLLPCVSGFSQTNTAAATGATGETTVASESPQRIFVSTPSIVQRTVEDFMTPRDELHVLYPHVSCDEAIMVLLNNGISGAPVVNPDNGNLMGVISSSDFMFKDYSGAVINMEGSEENLAGCVELAQKIVGTTVSELMSHQVMTIPLTDSMAKAADQMKRNNLHRLMVVDPADHEKLVGLLTMSDVMRDVLSTVRAALPEKGTHDDTDEDMSGLQP